MKHARLVAEALSRGGLLVPVAAVAAALLLAACGLVGSSGNETPQPGVTVPPFPDVSHTAVVTPAPPESSPTPDPTPGAEPTPPVPPANGAAALGEDLMELQAALERTIASYWVDGKYAVAVTDLQTMETVGVNGRVPHLGGCVLNLFVLYQVARDVEAGLYPLDRIDSLVRRTTWSSNATTARDLYAIAGGDDHVEGLRRVQQLIHDVLGLHDVVLDHPPGYHEYSLGIDYNNWVTAEAMNLALAALWRGDVVGEEMREYLLDRLEEVMPGLNYLTAAVPATVSHKNGFFWGDTGYVDNDVGIVRLVRGNTEYAYAISFFSEEVPVKYGDIVLGQQLGSLVYDAMSGRYPRQADTQP